jgi:hypothetical protein
LTFSYRSSRSASLTIGFGLILTIETVVLHLLLQGRYPALAWLLTIGSLLTLAYLAADYQRLGRDSLTVNDRTLELRVGLRARAEIPLEAVVRAKRPTWQELPETGSPDAKEYRNLMHPASPNVLLVLRAPHTVVFANIIRVPVRGIGLHLDDPDGFVTAISNAQVTAHASDA